jgi:hypothetical protein
MKFEINIPDWLVCILLWIGSAEIGILLGAILTAIIEAL